MAIINSRILEFVQVYPAPNGEGNPRVIAQYIFEFDDTEDAELPVKTRKNYTLVKTRVTLNEAGEEVEELNDHSSHDPLVQTICAAVWAE